MKKIFFTLLALLAMVCSSVDAQTTETVTISATVGARTYVSSHDLDFSSFNKNAAENNGVYDLNLTPYYISDYNVTTGAFKLTRFSDDNVPANTPMILLGKQYKAGKFAGDEISFEVPVITMAVGDANKAKYKVWGNNWVWLVPANKTSHDGSIDWFDASYVKQGSRDVVFFDNTDITEGARLPLDQTKNVQVGLAENIVITKTYLDEVQLPKANRGDIWNGNAFSASAIGYGDASTKDKIVIFWAYDPSLPFDGNAAYGAYQCTDYGEYGYYWMTRGHAYRTSSSQAHDYDSDAGHWIETSKNDTTYTPIYESYTQYFLGANGITPVFKKCNTNGSNGVKYGGAYVRVWSTLLGGGAAAREDMSFELFDEDGTEITYQNDDVTGIRSLQNTVDAKKENRQVYNLQGQKLDKMKPGLNIVNGKKYFVK